MGDKWVDSLVKGSVVSAMIVRSLPIVLYRKISHICHCVGTIVCVCVFGVCGECVCVGYNCVCVVCV